MAPCSYRGLHQLDDPASPARKLKGRKLTDSGLRVERKLPGRVQRGGGNFSRQQFFQVATHLINQVLITTMLAAAPDKPATTEAGRRATAGISTTAIARSGHRATASISAAAIARSWGRATASISAAARAETAPRVDSGLARRSQFRQVSRIQKPFFLSLAQQAALLGQGLGSETTNLVIHSGRLCLQPERPLKAPVERARP